ncbi:hypothetical protein GALMADRAFT_1121476 [Galerina marginata CBS 339.88]|uniref:Uncharacterized protein n=1 Tax=Galerina marginata (strain CBS 339.88) TaxID=685588 RepID=A0A067TFE3_GALM3|nr:hypothetical protein GALMADRAFT_1121476 [Galerina marginata CBS 339.88]
MAWSSLFHPLGSLSPLARPIAYIKNVNRGINCSSLPLPTSFAFVASVSTKPTSPQSRSIDLATTTASGVCIPTCASDRVNLQAAFVPGLRRKSRMRAVHLTTNPRPMFLASALASTSLL